MSPLLIMRVQYMRELARVHGAARARGFVSPRRSQPGVEAYVLDVLVACEARS